MNISAIWKKKKKNTQIFGINIALVFPMLALHTPCSFIHVCVCSYLLAKVKVRLLNLSWHFFVFLFVVRGNRNCVWRLHALSAIELLFCVCVFFFLPHIYRSVGQQNDTKLLGVLPYCVCVCAGVNVLKFSPLQHSNIVDVCLYFC